MALIAAVDFDQAPSYWFPRDCPRVLTWASASTTTLDRERFLGTSSRVHALEYAWLDRLLSTVLYAYRFDKSQFMTYGTPEPHAYVSTATVRPLHPPEQVGPLLDMRRQELNSARWVTCGRTGRRLCGAPLASAAYGFVTPNQTK